MNTTYPKSPIPKSWDIPLPFKQRVGSEVGRQRILQHDDHILLVLHQVPKLDDDGKREPALFWKDPDNQWKSLTHGGGIRALQTHLSHYEEVMEKLDDRLDHAKYAADYFSVLREVKPLLRASRNMVTVLESLRSAMPDDYTIMSIRDQGIGIERSVEFIDSDARHGMDFCMAESAAEQARATHAAGAETRQLNRMVAFFFPLATLAAILGMNPPSEVLGSAHIWLIILLGCVTGWWMLNNKSLFRKQPGDDLLKSPPKFPFKRSGKMPIDKNPIARFKGHKQR
jgi:hypothetical protein